MILMIFPLYWYLKSTPFGRSGRVTHATVQWWDSAFEMFRFCFRFFFRFCCFVFRFFFILRFFSGPVMIYGRFALVQIFDTEGRTEGRESKVLLEVLVDLKTHTWQRLWYFLVCCVKYWKASSVCDKNDKSCWWWKEGGPIEMPRMEWYFWHSAIAIRMMFWKIRGPFRTQLWLCHQN